MTVIVCTDPRGGMLFLGRRVSRDREIIADIATLTDRPILAHPFSEKYLRTTSLAYRIDEELLRNAEAEDFCFIESLPLLPHLDAIDRLIVYDFGERYPHDFKLDLDPASTDLHLESEREIVGHSHKLITRKVYTK